MGEDVQMRDYEGDEDEERVLEWEDGLPSVDDLTPLSQPLISPELASAFSITPEPCRTMIDVNRASQTTLSSLCRQNEAFLSSNLKQLPSFTEDRSRSRDSVVVEGDEPEQDLENEKLGNSTKDGSSIRKLRRLENAEDVSSALQMENSNDDQSAQTLKRPRLVWTPQLHKRFVDVITHLGIKNAVPKTIMQLMNVEGLTRENVASHLQKYRQYLKRMQGLSNEGPSSSDPLFASTPVPQSLHESSQQGYMPVPMSYGVPLMSMPYLGLPHGQGHMGMLVGNTGSAAYHGFDPNHYNMFRERQRDWCGNNVSRHHVTPNDN